MATVNIDRLLEACIKMGGSDLHLTVGRPPVFANFRAHFDRLIQKFLSLKIPIALMKSITPERNQQELQEEGGTDYGFAFGDAGDFESLFSNKKEICCDVFCV